MKRDNLAQTWQEKFAAFELNEEYLYQYQIPEQLEKARKAVESEMPNRPKETRPLKVDPPGSAVWGRVFLKMMSRMVSPMPITFLIIVYEFNNAQKYLF